MTSMTEQGRFRAQAAIGFLSVIALSSSALIAALAVERDATSDGRRIVAEYRREVGAAHQLELGAERLVAAARGYLLSGDPDFRRALADARGEFEASVRTVEENLRSPGREQVLLRIRDATIGYRSALEKLGAGRAGDVDLPSLSRVFEDMLVPRRRDLTRAIREFVADRERALAEGQATMQRRIARAERRVVAIGILTPVIAILLAVVIWRRLNHLYARQKVATERAEVAIARRDELLGVVAHDLRSPLNAIALRASLMCEDIPGAARRDSWQAIQRIVYRMDDLIKGLLDSAAIESGQLRLFKEDCRVGDIVGSLVETFKPLAVDKGLRFAVRGSEPALVVAADRERIIQALSNLLSNAVKFARPGDRIELRVDRSESTVQFDVCDTGPGIPADIRPRVFDRYQRGRRGGGVGLGLYIAKAIVDAHRGTIDLATAEGRGTVFRVKLPTGRAGAITDPIAATDGAQPPRRLQRG
jgi:signal transduction histidine kinase